MTWEENEWEGGGGELLSLLIQNVLLIISIFVKHLYHSFLIDTALMFVQAAFFVITMILAYRADRFWVGAVAFIILFLHIVVYA